MCSFVHLFIYLFFFFVFFFLGGGGGGVCVLITPKLMNTSLYFLWVGSLQREKLLIWGKDLDHIIETKKKNHEFPEVLFLKYF